MKHPQTNSSNGFTVIEIVIVIVVVAIIAVVALARVSDGNTFDAFALRDQLVSLIRTAQQSALGRADVEVTITPSLSLDTVVITTRYGGGPTTINSVEFGLSPISLTGVVNNTASCSVSVGTAITNGAPFIIRFDELGDLENSGFAAGTTVTDSVKICLNNEPSNSVCVSPGGFAYAGDCDV